MGRSHSTAAEAARDPREIRVRSGQLRREHFHPPSAIGTGRSQPPVPSMVALTNCLRGFGDRTKRMRPQPLSRRVASTPRSAGPFPRGMRAQPTDSIDHLRIRLSFPAIWRTQLASSSNFLRIAASLSGYDQPSRGRQLASALPANPVLRTTSVMESLTRPAASLYYGPVSN